MTLADAEAAYFDVLLAACQSLGAAAKALGEAHKEVVRPPRPRRLVVTPHLTWPYVIPSGQHHAGRACYDVVVRSFLTSRSLLVLHREADCREIAHCIIDDHHMRPKQVYRTLRRLQVACIWCQDRKAGVEREIDEIFRQQAHWHTLLTREHHFLELGGHRQP